MSKIGLAVLFSLGFGIISFAQSNQQASSKIPASVLKTFQEKFPEAKAVKWSEESDEEMEAEFKAQGNKYSASFKKDGSWLETEEEVKKQDLPAAVTSTLASQFADYEIEECEKITTPEAEGNFEVLLEKREETIEVVLDKSGKVIKKEIEEEEEDN